MGQPEELPRQGRQRRAARPRRNGERDFHGEKRANDTHESKTDPEAKLFRKESSQPAKLYFMGHALIENRHGLVVQADATQATGTAERQAALAMIDRQDPGSERRLTLAADKDYDTSGFVADLRQKCVTPHVAAKVKGSAIDGRTTRHAGYKVSQRKRKLVEEAFGWGKSIAGLAKVKVRGLARALQVHVRDGRLQSDPHAETAGGGVNSKPRPPRSHRHYAPELDQSSRSRSMPSCNSVNFNGLLVFFRKRLNRGGFPSRTRGDCRDARA